MTSLLGESKEPPAALKVPTSRDCCGGTYPKTSLSADSEQQIAGKVHKFFFLSICWFYCHDHAQLHVKNGEQSKIPNVSMSAPGLSQL